jgi:hypothetical protein
MRHNKIARYSNYWMCGEFMSVHAGLQRVVRVFTGINSDSRFIVRSCIQGVWNVKTTVSRVSIQCGDRWDFCGSQFEADVLNCTRSSLTCVWKCCSVMFVCGYTGSLSSGEVLCCAVLCCVNGCSVPAETAVEAFEPGTIKTRGPARKT